MSLARRDRKFIQKLYSLIFPFADKVKGTSENCQQINHQLEFMCEDESMKAILTLILKGVGMEISRDDSVKDLCSRLKHKLISICGSVDYGFIGSALFSNNTLKNFINEATNKYPTLKEEAKEMIQLLNDNGIVYVPSLDVFFYIYKNKINKTITQDDIDNIIQKNTRRARSAEEHELLWNLKDKIIAAYKEISKNIDL